jgi:hypothetical protein
MRCKGSHFILKKQEELFNDTNFLYSCRFSRPIFIILNNTIM